MADKYVFDGDQITGELLEDFEEQVGIPFFSLADAKTGEVDMANFTGRALSGLMWMAMRMSGREDVPFDEARRTPMSMLELGAEDDESEDELDPTDASSES